MTTILSAVAIIALLMDNLKRAARRSEALCRFRT